MHTLRNTELHYKIVAELKQQVVQYNLICAAVFDVIKKKQAAEM